MGYLNSPPLADPKLFRTEYEIKYPYYSYYAGLLYGKQFFGHLRRSDWLIFGRDFTVRTITMETVRLCIFSRSLPGNSKLGETQ